MKWPHAVGGLMITAASLLPSAAVPESQIQTPAPGKTVSASAHVNFKIVIPQVLFLNTTDAQNVAVLTNNRNVTLNATTGNAGHNFILSAGRGRGIARDAPCTFAPARPVICTVSMP